MFDGQSLVHAPSPGTPFASLAMAGRGRDHAAVAVQGTTYAQRATTVAARTDQLAKSFTVPVLVDVAGQSDLLAGLTAAQVLAAAESYADARRAAGFVRIIGATVPHSTSYTAGQNTERLAYNALLKASTHFDAVVDLAAIPELQDASNATYFYDGLHWTTAGAQLAATAFAPYL